MMTLSPVEKIVLLLTLGVPAALVLALVLAAVALLAWLLWRRRHNQEARRLPRLPALPPEANRETDLLLRYTVDEPAAMKSGRTDNKEAT
jgi:hypothetical protein